MNREAPTTARFRRQPSGCALMVAIVWIATNPLIMWARAEMQRRNSAGQIPKGNLLESSLLHN
jgi:hypothetical protein